MKNKTSTKRILIADDHPMLRYGLAQLINHEPDLQVGAEAENARQVLDTVARQKFDLVLLDLSLPDKNGLELIKDLRVAGWIHIVLDEVFRRYAVHCLGNAIAEAVVNH